LAPTLFNLYTSDLPLTRSRKYIYADDICLATKAKTMEELSGILTADIKTMSQYFNKWHLRLSEAKTVASVFHLNHKNASEKLSVTLGERNLDCVSNPTYLGVTLDRCLTYKAHLEKLRKKVGARVNLIKKVAGTTWGAPTHTLRTSTAALVYAPAEYCAPVWSASSHTYKIDIELNNAMRIVSGTLKSTPTSSLPVLSNIPPPHIRRSALTAKVAWRAVSNETNLVHTAVTRDSPSYRLNTRSAFSRRAKTYISLGEEIPMSRTQRKIAADTMIKDMWTQEWENCDNRLKEYRAAVEPPAGFNLSRRSWCRLNRLLTGHGRTGHMLQRWGMKETSACDCGAADQTAIHIVEECPRRRLEGGMAQLAVCDQVTVQWLQDLDLDI